MILQKENSSFTYIVVQKNECSLFVFNFYSRKDSLFSFFLFSTVTRLAVAESGYAGAEKVHALF
jgi:hypothetical protein